MGNLYPLVALCALAFMIDFTTHRYVFPLLAPPPVKAPAKANETTPEEPAVNEEPLPPNPQGISVQDENGTEIPVDTSHVLDDENTETPTQAKTGPASRKGDFRRINVHIKLW